MKHNFPFLIAMLLFLISLCFNIYLLLRPNPYLIETTNQKIKSSGMLSMMLETETGKYEESKNNSWPDNHYVLNESLSGCENGSKLIWDEKARSVKVNAQSSDRCYIYFDHEEFSKYILNLYQKDGDSNIYYHDKTGNYENSSLEAGDLSYRYSGSSESVENYVCLDGTSKDGSCQNGDADLYRIIGLFKNDQDQYEIKLIKYDYASPTEMGDATPENGGAYYGILDTSGSNYKGTNTKIGLYYWNYAGVENLNKATGVYNNMWKNGNLNAVLNGFYFDYITNKVNILKEKIVEHDYIVGGFSNEDVIPQKIYDYEVGNNRLSSESKSCFDEDYHTGARLCNQENDLIFKTKIGLMYVSDYAYSAYPKAWNTIVEETGYDQTEVKNNNWMYMGLHDFAISRTLTGHGARAIYANGFIRASYASAANPLRPAFYLDSSTKLASGDGSKTNPYRLNLN